MYFFLFNDKLIPMEEKKKKKIKLKDIFNLYFWIKFAVGLGTSGLLFILIYALNGFTTIWLINSLFVATIFSLSLAALSFATNAGTFDVISLGFKNMFLMAKKEVDEKYDLFQYREMKSMKRKVERFSFLGYLFSFLIFLIVYLSFYFIIY